MTLKMYILVLFYSYIPNHVADTQTDIQLSFPFSTKYLTLLLIVRHSFFFFFKNRKFSLDSCWCLDMFYCPTFFMYHNLCTDCTYMLVQFKLNQFVNNLQKNGQKGRNTLFRYCEWNDTLIYVQTQHILAHQKVMNWLSKERKDTSCHIMFRKDQVLKNVDF